MTPLMRRVWAMPNAETFDIPPIYQFVQKYLTKSKVSIDPFARNKRWATYTNDLNPDTAAEWHLDALDFLLMLKDKGVRADLIIFDPPYSPRQMKEVYDGVGLNLTMQDTQRPNRWMPEKRLVHELPVPDGLVLWFGWSSAGMGQSQGYAVEDFLDVCHGCGHYDTLCIAERKVQARLTDLEVLL